MTVTASVNAPVPAYKRHRGLLAALLLTVLVGLVFVVGAALPYYQLDGSPLQGYASRRWWVLLHITAGIVALFSGPVQLWLGLTDQRPAAHRRLGTVYLLAVCLSAVAGYYLSFHTDGPIGFGAGLAGLATAWLVTSGLAYAAIRRQLYDQHREWMIRSYVVTTGFVSFRAVFQTLAAADAGTAGEQLTIASWFCWAVPLLVTEAWLQGRKIFAVPAGR